jgi:hypothetical protein
MVEALLVIIFVAAALSLMSYLYCWQDIKTGRPHIITLRQITSIMDRHRLNAIFGNPEPGYFYTIPPETLAYLIRRYRGFYMRECIADAVCMLGSWRYMLHYADPAGLPLFLCLALACQGINILYSLWLIRKWRDQLREEMENPRE